MTRPFGNRITMNGKLLSGRESALEADRRKAKEQREKDAKREKERSK
jgi:hypothetical protein